MGKYHFRRSVSLTARGYLRLEKLAAMANRSCSGYLEELLTEDARRKGIIVTQEEVEAFKDERRRQQDADRSAPMRTTKAKPRRVDQPPPSFDEVHAMMRRGL